MSKKPCIEKIHYYLEDGKVVYTSLFHAQRGICCGNKCRHCPFTEGNIKGNTQLKPEYAEYNVFRNDPDWIIERRSTS